MRDGPFPVHYEPFESPRVNLNAPKIRGNPVARVFPGDWKRFGDASEFPYAATTYRLTEHFHYWTKHCKINAILQPEFFVEISEQLAAEKGVAAGDWVRGVEQARLGEGEGGRHQAHQAPDLRRQAGSTSSACPSTGASSARPRKAMAPTR